MMKACFFFSAKFFFVHVTVVKALMKDFESGKKKQNFQVFIPNIRTEDSVCFSNRESREMQL